MACHGGPDIVEDNLVLCLDAANTKSYPGSGTTWFDLSGNGHTGTLSNGPTFSSNNGGIIDFDGNDHADFASSSDFTFGTGDFTISQWLNYDTLQGSSVDMRGSSWTNTAFSNFIYQSNKWATWRKSSTYPSAADRWYISTATLVTGKWYNFVALRDSGTFKLYINNVLDGTVSFTESLAGGGLVMGVNVSNSNGFGGKMGPTMIYKGKALSETEVAQNYNSLKGRFGL